MQLIKVYEAFSAAELAKLEAELKASGKKECYELFRQLKNCAQNKTEYDRDRIFKAVFGIPYTSKLKYLLTNESRKLKHRTYDFIVHMRFNEELQKNPWYYNRWLMQWMSDNKIAEIFEKDIEKHIADAEDVWDFEAIVQLSLIKKEYIGDLGFNMNKSDEELIRFLEKTQHSMIQNLVIWIRELDAIKAFFINRNRQSKSTTEWGGYEKLNSIDFADYDNGIVQLFDLYGTSFFYDDRERLEFRVKVLNILDELGVKSRARLGLQDEQNLRASISASLLVYGDFAQALHYLKQEEKFAQENNLALVNTHNYKLLQAYLGCKMPEKAIEFFSENEEALKGDDFFDSIVHYTVYAYFNCSDTVKGIKLFNAYLLQSTDNNSEISHIHKQCLIVAALVDGEIIDAERELQNYMRSKLYKNANSPYITEAAELLKRYIKLLLVDKQNDRAQIQQLNGDVTDYLERYRSPAICIEWLKNKLDQ